MRSRRFAIAHDYCAAFRGLAEKQLREIKWHADAAVARRITGESAGVHRDTGPSQSLHVRHRRVVVFLRVMLLLLLKNAKDAARGSVSFRAGTHRRAANEDAVPIHVHGLLGNANEDHEGTARWKLWRPR